MTRFNYENPPKVNELVRVASINFTKERHGRNSNMLNIGDFAKIKEIIGRSAYIHEDCYTYDIKDFETSSPTDEELLNSSN